MIIHSPIISGSLTFADGSTFTLPDGGNYSGSFSGSIQISEIQSHLIPNTNEEYDLGSSTNRFRDLYLSNNTINFPSGSLGFGSNGFGFSDTLGAPAPIVTSEVKVLDESDGSFAKLAVVGGTLTTTAFDPFGVESAFDMKSQLSGSFTGSFLGEMLATNGVVSGSSQITIGSVTGFSAYSESVDDRILIEKGRVDAILASSDADKDSFAEIVTLINSVDTTNDNAFASFYTSSTDRLDNIEGFTSSIDATIKTKMDADSVVSGSSQLVSLLPSGVVSSSAQVNADSITNFDSNVKTKLDSDGVISSSIQVDVLQTTNFTEFSSSVADTFGGLSTDYNDLQNIPSGIISSSEQLAADFLDTLGDNVVSSSAQVDLTQTTNYASGIKLKLDAENVFSSSEQVTLGDVTGFNTFSSSVSDTFDGLSSNYEDLVGIPSGIVSGSSQIDVTQTTNYSTVSSHISSTSNPHSVTATQVGLGNVDNTSDANKPISTATQTALDLKADGADLTSHSSRTDNPHGVTKSQVGLGNVDNTSDVNKPISTATQTALDLKATVSDLTSHSNRTDNPHSVTATQVGLGNVDNTSDANKPVSTATQTALNLKATVSALNTEVGRIDAILASSDADKDSFAEIVTLINSVDTENDTAFAGFVTSSNAAQAVQDGRLDSLETESGSISSDLSNHVNDTTNPHSVTATQVGLGNVTNESKATMFTSPTFTGTVSGVSKSMVGLGNVDNTSDVNKPISTATQTALNLKATVSALTVQTDRIDDLETFSSSLDGGFVTEAELASATGALETTISTHSNRTDNPHSVTATQVGLGSVTNESKSTMFTSPTFTGTVSGVSKAMVGLGNVDNTSDSAKPVSTAQQAALDLKATVSSLNTEKGRIDAILASSDADRDSFAEIVTLINSVDTTNDTAFAGFVTSSNAAQSVQDGRLDALEADSSLSTHINDTSNPHSVTATQVGLGNVTNESKSTMFTSPTFTGTVSGVSKAMVGLGNVENTTLSTYTGQGGALNNQYITNGAGYITSFTNTQLSNEQVQDIVGAMVTGNTESGITVTYQDADGTIDFSVASQTDNNFTNALKTKLDGIATGAEVNTVDSVAGKTGVVTLVKGDVGLGSVDNTSDAAKPVSTAQQAALNLKADDSDLTTFIARTDNPHSVTATQVGLGDVTNESKSTMFTSPTFTGTVSGVTATHVGLGSVDNTSDADKPVSTAQQDALDGKLDTTHDFSITLTGDVTGTGTVTNMGNVSFSTTVGDDSHNHTIANVDGLQTALDGKQSAGSYVTTTSAQSLSSAANALTLSGNILTLARGDSSTDTIDLSAYLDEDSRSISSGTLNSVSGIVTFTRDDASTFTLDLSDLLDDTNLVTSVAGRNGVVTLDTDDVVEAGNLYYTDARVKAKLNAEGVISGSGQVTITQSQVSDVTATAGELNILDGVTSTTAELNILDGVTATTAEINKLDGVTATTAELNFVDGVTSNIQVQLNNKLESFDITTQTDSKYLRSNTTDTATGVITFSNSTASTSTTTGAVKVTGGVGIGGALNVGGDVVAYASSDKRLKDNIVNIENPIEKVQKLNGVTWDWNGNADELQQSLPNVGVIAQEVEEVFPQLVHDRENGYKGVDYAKLTGLLIEAVKEQQKQIDELKSRLG